MENDDLLKALEIVDKKWYELSTKERTKRSNMEQVLLLHLGKALGALKDAIQTEKDIKKR